VTEEWWLLKDDESVIFLSLCREENMKIAYTIRQLGTATAPARKSRKTIGFVPTMGALHEGHLSLVRICRSQNDLVVVSIFVNPTQFNDPNDLKDYPRMTEKDIGLLQPAGCDVVFIPEHGEIYPEPDTRTYNFDGLDKTMEGRFRPGHFNGVAQVVTRLFQIVKPQRAYFGLKDFQQQAILKKVVRDLNLPVELVVCPIIREPDGLAMSSRNLLLTPEQRKHATVIHETLSMAKKMSETHTPDEVRQFVTDRINLDKLLQIEYFEIADNTTLVPVKSWSEPGGKIGCIAVRVGKIRLIDNIDFSS